MAERCGADDRRSAGGGSRRDGEPAWRGGGLTGYGDQDAAAATQDAATTAARVYSAIAPSYDSSYAVPGHRKLYDQLAWDLVQAVPRPDHAHVVDVGCGTGRWAQRFLALGCRVTGIEAAPGMIAEIERRRLGPGFTLLRRPMEAVDLPADGADLVLAMGSVQYAADPAAMLRSFGRWLRPGGVLCLYVDSLVSLVIELLRGGEEAEALDRLRTRRGMFAHGPDATPVTLYDRAALEADLVAAGLTQISCRGLAVGAAAIGRAGLSRSMMAGEGAVMAREALLSADPVMADCGLHLFATGRKPERGGS